MRHKTFVDVFFSKGLMRHKTKGIQSKLHRIGTYDVCKNYCLGLMIKDTY